MRNELIPYLNEVLDYTGTVTICNERRYKYPHYKSKMSVLLVDVKLDGEVIADHIWIQIPKEVFDRYHIRENVELLFTGIARSYIKGSFKQTTRRSSCSRKPKYTKLARRFESELQLSYCVDYIRVKYVNFKNNIIKGEDELCMKELQSTVKN